MKLVIYPSVDEERLRKIKLAAGEMTVVNAESTKSAVAEIADAFFGKLTSDLLAAGRQLRWVQAPTVSLEHYIFSRVTRDT